MLELDAWLAGFLETGYAGLEPDERRAFALLLEEDDFRLFDWLTNRSPVPERYRTVVQRIRGAGKRTA